VLDAAHLICKKGGALSFGGIGGNPLAPELAAGDEPDRLSDVYAVGALIYRLLTGRKVDPQRFIEPPSHFNPAVDSELDELVLRALDEDPSERPYSAREIEQSLLGIFEELGLEPGSHAEATKLIDGSLPAGVAAAPKPRPAPAPVVRAAVVARSADVEDDDDEDFAPQRNKLQQFLYDLGWEGSLAQSERRLVPLGAEDEEGDEPKQRSRLSQFMYDLGWLQSIDWDAPKTRLWLKRGAIACGVLLALMVLWPSGKKGPRPGSAQALAAQAMVKSANTPQANVQVAPKAQPKLVKIEPTYKRKK
jgi:hypothetical protein